MSKLDQEIKARTERFAEELAELVKRAALDSVSQALAGGAAPQPSRAAGRRGPPARATGRKAGGGARRRKKGQKRSPEELEQLTKSLQQEIKREPGRGIEAIAGAMGVPTKELALPVKKLLEENRIKTRGQKRATKYFAK